MFGHFKNLQISKFIERNPLFFEGEVWLANLEDQIHCHLADLEDQISLEYQ